MKKIVILISFLFLLSGCSKIKGTWCRYIQTYSVYGIVKNDITNEEKEEVFNYFDTVKNLKTYDYLSDIKDAKGMFVIYLSSNEGIEEIKNTLGSYGFIYEADIKDIESTDEELVIKNKEFVYKYNLTSSDSSSYEGTYEFADNTIKTSVQDLKFYLRDDYLCKEFTCKTVFVKSKNKTCSN